MNHHADRSLAFPNSWCTSFSFSSYVFASPSSSYMEEITQITALISHFSFSISSSFHKQHVVRYAVPGQPDGWMQQPLQMSTEWNWTDLRPKRHHVLLSMSRRMQNGWWSKTYTKLQQLCLHHGSIRTWRPADRNSRSLSTEMSCNASLPGHTVLRYPRSLHHSDASPHDYSQVMKSHYFPDQMRDLI